MTEKEKLRQRITDLGGTFAQRDSIAKLKERLALLEGRKSAPVSKGRKVTTRKSSGSRSRSAALSRSAPTVRMAVDSQHEERRPGSADILAVALVIFLSLLAVGSTQLERLRGTLTQVQPVTIGEVQT